MKREKTDLIILHCSRDPETADIGAYEIDRRHRLEQRFRIGHHFVIRRDGTVEHGRAVDETGLHARGYNQTSIGVCLVGGVDKSGMPCDNFTDAQRGATAALLKKLFASYPDAAFKAHGELDPNKENICPVIKVSEILEIMKETSHEPI